MRYACAAAVVLSSLVGAPAVSDAAAAPAQVTVANMSFSPSRVSVGVGETVTWTFVDPISHTVTSDDGFFDTGPQSGGATRTIRFRTAGAFGYHCSIHPTMVGRVGVPVSATGSVDSGWKLRWVAGKTRSGRTYDVQVRRRGSSSWAALRKATTKGSARFDPGKGSWRVRARTSKGAATSGWSPAITLP